MSKLQEDFKDILPKLDEDFAKLEANLINDELDFEELLNFDGIDNDFDDKIEQMCSFFLNRGVGILPKHRLEYITKNPF